jgi:hypothetical protein
MDYHDLKIIEALRRVGKIEYDELSAWAKRMHDFAHAAGLGQALCPPYDL